jgi:hypothetical protein
MKGITLESLLPELFKRKVFAGLPHQRLISFLRPPLFSGKEVRAISGAFNALGGFAEMRCAFNPFLTVSVKMFAIYILLPD